MGSRDSRICAAFEGRYVHVTMFFTIGAPACCGIVQGTIIDQTGNGDFKLKWIVDLGKRNLRSFQSLQVLLDVTNQCLKDLPLKYS